MCRLNLFGLVVIIVGVLLLQLWTIEARPRTQKIVVHGHEWTVPNEPGWEKGEIISSACVLKLYFSSLQFSKKPKRIVTAFSQTAHPVVTVGWLQRNCERSS